MITSDTIYRVLMHSDAPMRPWEIRRLSLPELAVALDNSDPTKPRAPVGGVPNSPEYRRWLLSLTPRQRLELHRDGVVRSDK